MDTIKLANLLKAFNKGEEAYLRAKDIDTNNLDADTKEHLISAKNIILAGEKEKLEIFGGFIIEPTNIDWTEYELTSKASDELNARIALIIEWAKQADEVSRSL